MSDHPDQPAPEYNPSRDYQRFMEWAKYGIVLCAAIVLALRFLIG
jgi:hypothetical protein